MYFVIETRGWPQNFHSIFSLVFCFSKYVEHWKFVWKFSPELTTPRLLKTCITVDNELKTVPWSFYPNVSSICIVLTMGVCVVVYDTLSSPTFQTLRIADNDLNHRDSLCNSLTMKHQWYRQSLCGRLWDHDRAANGATAYTFNTSRFKKQNNTRIYNASALIPFQTCSSLDLQGHLVGRNIAYEYIALEIL